MSQLGSMKIALLIFTMYFLFTGNSLVLCARKHNKTQEIVAVHRRWANTFFLGGGFLINFFQEASNVI